MKDKHDHSTLELDLDPTFQDLVTAADKLNSKLPELTWSECYLRINPCADNALRSVLNRDYAVSLAERSFNENVR